MITMMKIMLKVKIIKKKLLKQKTKKNQKKTRVHMKYEWSFLTITIITTNKTLITDKTLTGEER